MSDSQRLRENRLIFYTEDIEQIGKVMRELLSLSAAKSALLIDKEGHMVAREGAVRTFDTDSLSALVAGSFAATREMAHLLGEEEFSVMFHQGQRDNIQLTLVDDTTILTVIFDDQTQLGMIRLYTHEAVKQLQDVFIKKAARKVEREHIDLDGDFANTGRANLDDVFGG
ncbi:MAG: roadblock/LC7 domain-containing protein [Planctomycetes bacterium]|nr:roadblock/LC7 domain-containing protein [Planctomycetota bacterium]